MMAFYTNLFTVDTYEKYLASDQTITGFRDTQEAMARRPQKGDILLGYIKGLSRWAAVMEMIDGPFIDDTPIFVEDNDPFSVRLNVKPQICLSIDHAIPIREPILFDNLSFTKGREEGGYWLGPLRRSLQGPLNNPTPTSRLY